MRGYQREREMIAGGAPIDCAQPLRPHITAVGMTDWARPSTPISAFAEAETTRPVAMKRLMLQ